MEQYAALADLYDGFMDDVDYGTWSRYIALFLERGGFPRTASILECGCGTGNITIPLKKAGFNITGTDVSEAMLTVAAEKARKSGLFIPFVRMDMRSLASHRPVDCVLACCDCVNYLTGPEDVSAFFRSAFSALKPGGMLLFDISSAYKLQNVLGCNCFTDSRADRAYFWRNNYDPESKLIEMELEFFVEKQSGLYDRRRERHIQRAHTEDELTKWLSQAGFSEIRASRAFTFDPPEANDERIQFAAVRPKK